MERERKFLVKELPGGLRRHRHKAIRQGYLAIAGSGEEIPVEVRVREEGGKYVLTVKGGEGKAREEIEVPISKKAFASVWPLTEGKRIAKVRYRIPVGKDTVELDVYRGKLAGLATAEVEFDSDRELRGFRPPPWLGREVTDRKEFGNSRLATSGKPRSVRGGKHGI
jgi:CYTH domain-containing protein